MVCEKEIDVYEVCEDCAEGISYFDGFDECSDLRADYD